MVAPAAPTEKPETAPHSEVGAWLIERNYEQLGCNGWNSRRVTVLCAKFGDTLTMLAARMRLRPGEFERRMKADCWTKQDGLILTLLEREIDLTRGIVAKGRLCL